MTGDRAGARRAFALLALALAAGAALRLPGLADRPMHADEAVLADKFGTLLESGSYRYDPAGYHGPLLLYLTLPSAWISGGRTYNELTETVIRAAPAVAGLLLVAAPFLLAGEAGWLPLGAAALLAAVSPAMVFYSRYYIPETLLTLLVFAAAGCGYRAVRSGRAAWAVLSGAAAGLALATKETAAAALAALLVAAGSPIRSARRWHLAAGAAAAAVSALLPLTSFLGNPRGVTDFLQSYLATYLGAAWGSSGHVHPWHFYLGLLWRGEAAAAALAAGGLAVALGTSRSPSPLRRLAVFVVLLLGFYSLLPYKTPWCLLAFWQPALVLAGYGAVQLLQAARGRARAAVLLALAAAAAALAAQSWRLSRTLAADPANPYVYAQTGPDVFLIRQRIEEIARIHPDGTKLEIQIFTTQNWWPLPWYLRGFPNVRWARAAPPQLPPAGVILASPDLEPAVIRKLYEERPPGERELYLHLFSRRVDLRPGVEVRGYVARRLAAP